MYNKVFSKIYYISHSKINYFRASYFKIIAFKRMIAKGIATGIFYVILY